MPGIRCETCTVVPRSRVETIKHFRCLEVHIFDACVSLDKLRLLGIGLVFQVNVAFKDSYKTKQTYEISLPRLVIWWKEDIYSNKHTVSSRAVEFYST